MERKPRMSGLPHCIDPCGRVIFLGCPHRQQASTPLSRLNKNSSVYSVKKVRGEAFIGTKSY